MPPLNPNINAGRDALTQSLMGNQGQGLGQMGAGTVLSSVAQLGAGLPPGLGGMPPSNPAMGGMPPGLGGMPTGLGGMPPGLGGMPTGLGGMPPVGQGLGRNPGMLPPVGGRNPMAAMGGMFGRR
jgi:hypothetical protein